MHDHMYELLRLRVNVFILKLNFEVYSAKVLCMSKLIAYRLVGYNVNLGYSVHIQKGGIQENGIILP